MKKLLMLFIISTNVYATNGSHLIASGANSRAMGGVGTALAIGAENIIKNPSLMAHQGKIFEFSATLINPKVETTNLDASLIGDTTLKHESALDSFFIPYLGFITPVSSKINTGVMISASGIGVDFRNENADNGLFELSSQLTLITFTPGMSFKLTPDFSIGLSLPFTVGILSLGYDNGNETGRGSAMDNAFAYDLGLSYLINKFTLGVNYRTKTNLRYNNQIFKAASDFGVNGILKSDQLDQPGELSFGVGYEANNFSASIDYKVIYWSKADGYEELRWDDQKLVNLGFSYTHNKLIGRLGASIGNSPVEDAALLNSASAAPNNAQALHLFNNLAFPATVENHYTFGLGLKCNENFNVDLTYLFAPERDTQAEYNAGTGDMTYQTSHSQSAWTIGARWNL